jgi:predicted PurR-regulated permease PerM
MPFGQSIPRLFLHAPCPADRLIGKGQSLLKGMDIADYTRAQANAKFTLAIQRPSALNSSDSAAAILATRRAFIVFGAIVILITIFLGFRLVLHAVLLYFASIIAGLVLVILTKWIKKVIPIHHVVALCIVILLLGGLGYLLIMLIGPQILSQWSDLIESVKKGLTKVQELSKANTWIGHMLSFTKSPGELVPSLAGGVKGAFVITAQFISESLFVVLMGVFLAANPPLYIDNAIRLFFPHRRELVHRSFNAVTHALRRWLLGRFIAMVMIGIFTTIGLLIAHIPLAAPLGIIAGILDFIPFVGPFISAIPAVLVALADEPIKAAWVLIIYLAVHLLEDFLTPIIQFGVAQLPPALLVSVQILLTMLAGMLGILVAEPVTMAIIVIIQVIYFKAYLQEDVMVLGEKKHRASWSIGSFRKKNGKTRGDEKGRA